MHLLLCCETRQQNASLLLRRSGSGGCWVINLRKPERLAVYCLNKHRCGGIKQQKHQGGSRPEKHTPVSIVTRPQVMMKAMPVSWASEGPPQHVWVEAEGARHSERKWLPIAPNYTLEMV